ncbi:MAG: hypothetical protein ABI592_08805 [Acidobacteriota bacterium]
MTPRRAPLLASALFIFYCTAVGVYLILHPWFPGTRAPIGISASGFFRGFISGVGLVHLFAAIVDLRSLARMVDPAGGPPGEAAG